MAIQKLLHNAIGIREQHGDPGQPVHHDSCTQASAAMILAIADGAPTDRQGVIDSMLSMCDVMQHENPPTFVPGQGSTIKGMAAELRRRGADVVIEWDYAGDVMPHDWHQALKDNAGVRPILLQVARAANLYSLAHGAEDVGVQYHAIAVIGLADNGYVIADPNNALVEQTFDIYPYAAQVGSRIYGIAAAEPCGLIMLNMKGATPVATIPSGWSDDGTTLTAPNGVGVVHGFRDKVLSEAWPAGCVPATAEEGFENGTVSRQRFHASGADGARILYWNAQAGVFYGDATAELISADQKLTDLQRQLDNANARLAEPPTVVVNVAEQKAVAAIAALKDALA